MKPEQLAVALRALIGVKRPVYIEGEPGVGKTAIARQVCAEMGLPVVHYHPPTKLPEDFGIPYQNDDQRTFDFRMLKSMPVEGSDCPDEGVILFDEAPQADPAMQKIIANIVHAREIHGHHIKKGWTFVATGNRVQDRAGASRLLSHLRNRMTSLSLAVDSHQWLDWARANGIDERIISFIQWQPTALHRFDPNRDINATPRSWAEGVHAALQAVPKELLLEVIQGDIGALNLDFVSFLELSESLPSREEWLKDPAKVIAELPRNTQAGGPEIGLLYALASMLMDSTDDANFKTYMECASFLPEDIGAMVFANFIRKNNTVSMKQPETYKACWKRFQGVVQG